MTDFQPGRLYLARSHRGLSGRALTVETGISPQHLANLENGHSQPSESTLGLLSRATQFPIRWFSRPLTLQDAQHREIGYRSSGLHARSLERLGSDLRRQLMARIALVAEVYRWLDETLELPVLSLPALSPEVRELPEVAAALCREAWGINNGPVYGLGALLDRQGFRVVSPVPDLDGGGAPALVSAWCDGYPTLLAPCEDDNAYQWRIEVAALVGRLLLFERPGPGQSVDAYRFARAFLVPGETWYREAPRSTAPTAHLEHAHRWRVPIRVLLTRSRELGVLSDAKYNSAYSMLIQNRMLNAPEDGPWEGGEMLINCQRVLGFGYSDLCDEFAAPSDVLQSLFPIFSLKGKLAPPPENPPPKTRLRIV